MKYIAILLIIIILLIPSCKKNIYKDDNDNDTQETVRFKPLSEPIEGKLYFVAGPTATDIDSMYNKYPWDFWQLSGTEFTKINDNPWYSDNSQWNFQWSPNLNYFSFFHDKGGDVPNTDDIGILNLSTFSEIYLTDSLGDANPGDQCLYQWSQDEEYIYFTALEYGVSEYEEDANSDIYRVRIDGSGLEKLTDTPYFEMVATPSPDGTKLAYIVDKWNNTPDSLQGYYIMDINTMESEMVVNTPYELYVQGELIEWHPSSEYLVIISERTGTNKITYINADTYDYYHLPSFQDIWYVYTPIFINGSNKMLLWIHFYSYEDVSEEKVKFYLYDFDTKIMDDLTEYLNTEDRVFRNFPVSSPSGKYLAFTASENALIDDEEYPEHPLTDWNRVYLTTEIYIFDLDTKEVRQLTNGLYGWEGHLKWIE